MESFTEQGDSPVEIKVLRVYE